MIKRRSEVGEAPDEIAADFGIGVSDVEEALRFEHAAAAP